MKLLVSLTFALLANLTIISSTLITSSAPRPLVIWHGLGDSHSSPGMLQFVSMLKDIFPGIFIHSVYIEEDLAADRKAGFLVWSR